jgi:hypothetical protein
MKTIKHVLTKALFIEAANRGPNFNISKTAFTSDLSKHTRWHFIACHNSTPDISVKCVNEWLKKNFPDYCTTYDVEGDERMIPRYTHKLHVHSKPGYQHHHVATIYLVNGFCALDTGSPSTNRAE